MVRTLPLFACVLLLLSSAVLAEEPGSRARCGYASQRHLGPPEPWELRRGVQSREHLFKSCMKWKSQQAILSAEVRQTTKKRKVQVQISELFVEEPTVLLCVREGGQ